MRKVLSDRHEVAHFFANKVQDEGRAGNMFFEDGRLFSYGRHFCVARWISADTVAVTTQSYSPSTARHISIARNALNHVREVRCYDPAACASENKRHAMDLMEGFIDSSTRPRIRQSTRNQCMAYALNKAVQFNEYLEALTPEDRGVVTPIPTDNLDEFAALRKRQLDEARAVSEAENLKQAEKAREVMTEWRNGHDVDVYRLRNLPVALRLGYHQGMVSGVSDIGESDSWMIETSWGANIPRSDAPKLWELVKACHEQDRPLVFNVGVPLGNYRLNRIDANGDIHVGCHHIKYDELALMAEKLGYDIPIEV